VVEVLPNGSEQPFPEQPMRHNRNGLINISNLLTACGHCLRKKPNHVKIKEVIN